jgi:hypothetical protein
LINYYFIKIFYLGPKSREGFNGAPQFKEKEVIMEATVRETTIGINLPLFITDLGSDIIRIVIPKRKVPKI